MIGNYINIDYEKLPRRKQEEVKEPEKDYSSIGKLLQHPKYKDIIGNCGMLSSDIRNKKCKC